MMLVSNLQFLFKLNRRKFCGSVIYMRTYFHFWRVVFSLHSSYKRWHYSRWNLIGKFYLLCKLVCYSFCSEKPWHVKTQTQWTKVLQKLYQLKVAMSSSALARMNTDHDVYSACLDEHRPWRLQRLLVRIQAMTCTALARTNTGYDVYSACSDEYRPWRLQHLLLRIQAMTCTALARTNTCHDVYSSCSYEYRLWLF